MGFLSKLTKVFKKKHTVSEEPLTFNLDDGIWKEDISLPLDQIQTQPNPTKLDPAKIPEMGPATLSYATSTRTARGSFVPSEYDLAEIGIIEDVDGIVSQAFQKKFGLMFKEGFHFVGPNKKTVEYTKIRLRQIEQATAIPTQELLRRIGSSLIKMSNAFLLKIRKEEFSGGKLRTDPTGKEKLPVAAYFPIAPETMSAEFNQQGKIVRWRQTMPDGRTKEYPADDIVHFHINRKEGFLFGTPTITPVIDDIRALRQIEENLELLIYNHVFPLFHYIVGTETAPAGLTEAGEREIDVARNELRYMPAEGGIVTPERHEIKLIGAEGRALRAEGYITYFKRRVIAGLGISEIDLGISDTSNRSTANVLSRALIDSVKSIQDSLEAQFDHLVIKELLLESPFGTNVLLDPNLVHLQFSEIDIENKIRQEEHALKLFEGNGITYSEYRTKLGYEPIEIPEDPHEQDLSKYPDWATTYWKLFEEPSLLIRAIDEPYSPSALAAAEARSTSLTKQTITTAQQAKEKEIETQGKANKPPPKPSKDSYIRKTFGDLKSDTISRFISFFNISHRYDEVMINTYIRIWTENVTKHLISQCVPELLNGFNTITSNKSHLALDLIKSGRSSVETRIRRYSTNFAADLGTLISQKINELLEKYPPETNDIKIYTSAIDTAFTTMEYRIKFIEDTEEQKAFNYGKILGFRFNNIKQIQYVRTNSSICEMCDNGSNQDIEVKYVNIDDVIPHHPGCLCRIKMLKNKDSIVEDGAKFERCIKKVKKSLRKSHPDWDGKKNKSVAYAICTTKLKK